MLDHVACMHTQFSNSVMAEAANIAVDTDSAWLVKFCVTTLYTNIIMKRLAF